MNAQAVKRFVEENQKLAAECESLVEQRVKLERECALYDHDREALMEFGNEADERAQEAQERALELERDLCLLEQELIKYKQQNESVSLCFHLSCFIGLFQLSGLIEIITGVLFNYLRQFLIYMIYETTDLRLIQLGSVEGFD